MSAYSFLDCNAAIVGPYGAANMGAGAGCTEGGVKIEAVEDRNIMTIGADGQGMHSLVASQAVTCTVELLKTSVQNAILQQMFNAQSKSAATWGRNTISITDLSRGDFIVLEQAAFKKQPAIGYTKAGEANVWTFDAIVGNINLGIGSPEV